MITWINLVLHHSHFPARLTLFLMIFFRTFNKAHFDQVVVSQDGINEKPMPLSTSSIRQESVNFSLKSSIKTAQDYFLAQQIIFFESTY